MSSDRTSLTCSSSPGLVSVLRAIPVPKGGYIDLLARAGLCAMLLTLAGGGRPQIIRGEGAVLLKAYLAYVTWRTLLAA